MKPEVDLLPIQRQRRILLQAASREVVRVDELAQLLGVHEVTIRRDLDDLARRGLIERVRGGARLAARGQEELSYSVRAAAVPEAKAAIARKALELVGEGETLGLDASTTALALARLLRGRRVQVVTTGLDAASALAEEQVPFTLIGGTFHAPARSFVGSLANASLERLHLSKVFFSAKGYTPQAGFTDAYPPEVECKEHLIRAGKVVVALLDHTKFGVEALLTIVREDQVDIVVTDREPPREALVAFRQTGTQVLVAQ